MEGGKKSDVVGNKVSCSVLHENTFSLICTTGAFKSASAGSWDFTMLYFSEPKFQIITPTSVTNEGSKTLEISESHLEPQRAKSLEASQRKVLTLSVLVQKQECQLLLLDK